MSRLHHLTDPFEVANAQYSLAYYNMVNEVEHWVSNECADDHIFIDAVIVANFAELDKDSKPYRIYVLTLELLDEFDEDKADELIDLVRNLPSDLSELFHYYGND